MPTASDDALQTVRRQVHELLGRCFLGLQHYELLLKAVVAQAELSGTIRDLETARATRINKYAHQTLGGLVTELLGSYLVSNEAVAIPVDEKSITSEDVISFTLRISLELPDEELTRIEGEIRDLVSLRNNLVHHFLEQYDLRSLEGCHSAIDALHNARDRIRQNVGRLQDWARDTSRIQRLAAETFQSEDFLDFLVNPNAFDEPVARPAADAVRALREAAGELAVDGWTPVEEAGRWVAECFPEISLEAYRYRSWKQVVHECRVFELKYFERDGIRAAWYRDRERAK